MKRCMYFLICFSTVFGEGLLKCQDLVSSIELVENLPKGLLSAIINVESSGMPWVIGVRGVSYRYHTKEEAAKKINELVAQGERNFDIGCAQINYHHHKHQFESIHQMLHPETNIRYAAKFLKQLFSESGNWNKAIAYYNSRDLSVSGVYMAKVHKAWNAPYSSQKKLKDPLEQKAVQTIVTSRVNQARIAYNHYKRTITFKKTT